MTLKFIVGRAVANHSTPIFIGMVAVGLMLTPAAKAQQYGYGAQPGMQGCNYPYGQAGGAVAESDAAQELERQISDLEQQRREARAQMTELNREKRQLVSAINRAILPKWASAFMAHMDNTTYNCCVEGDVAVKVPNEPRPRKRPPLPIPGKKAPRKSILQPPPDEGDAMSMNEPVSNESDRMPASVAGTGIDEDGLGPDLGEGAPRGRGGGGDNPSSPTSCYPRDSMYTMAKWKGLACEGPGKISTRVCSGPYFTNGSGGGGDVSCSTAISRYAQLARELDEAEKQNADLNDQIFGLRHDLNKQKSEDRLEAGCAECAAARANRGGAGGNFGPTMRAMSPVLGASAGLSAGVRIGPVSIGGGISTGGPGPLAMPYGQGGYGYPMAQNGVYGAVPGGVNGGFGCAGGVGGGGYPNGPYGMGGPYGQNPYQQGGAFGYPPGYQPGWPGLGGGGAYAPGYGPWGVAGPWGNSPAGINAQVNTGGGLGGILGGLLGGITRTIGGLFGGGGGGFGFGRPGFGVAGSGGYPGFGFGNRIGGAPSVLPISGGGSPFGASTLSPFGVGSQPMGSPFRVGSSYSPYGVSGISGGTSYLPYMNQNTNYYNNMIGQQIQQQQLYSKYLSAQTTLGQFNNNLNMFNGGYGYGGQSYAPAYLPAMQTTTPYGY